MKQLRQYPQKKGQRKSHVLCKGNRLSVAATREALGAMKYKAQ